MSSEARLKSKLFLIGMGTLSILQGMSTKAQAVLDQFKALPRAEQWEVYQAIARNVVPEDYGAPSDEELVAAAAQTFALLDEEETRAKQR